MIQGGLRILEMIEAVNYEVFRRRPKLSRRDWLVIFWRALRMSRKSVAAAAQENPLFPPSPTR